MPLPEEAGSWPASGFPGTPPAPAAAARSTSTAATARASSCGSGKKYKHCCYGKGFGRKPGPHDPVFFDMPPIEQIEFQTVQAMKKAGIDPAIIHAYEKPDGL